MKKYDVDYFIKKFKAIPEKEWSIGRLKGNEKKKCALGHCGVKEDRKGNYLLNEEGAALSSILGQSYWDVININDNTQSSLPTPKERILAALEKAKKAAK